MPLNVFRKRQGSRVQHSLTGNRLPEVRAQPLDGPVDNPGYVAARVRFGAVVLLEKGEQLVIKAPGVLPFGLGNRGVGEGLLVLAELGIVATSRLGLKDGKTRRAAVCIGPEHGTVGPDLVKEAAKEAIQGVGFDLLIVCGFAFDPHVSKETKRYGKLAILPARMNPDLAMGDELLKKTGAGNLFMVFGEPDVEIREVKERSPSPRPSLPGRGRSDSPASVQLVAEIKGVDIYDPTTGQIRNSSTDDIACWFIDTDYNGESFFVRHAYFTGAGDPYEKLKRALRADIDEAAWQTLYSTVSRPLTSPRPARLPSKSSTTTAMK